MKVEMKVNVESRRILTAMIMDKTVLAAVFSKWDKKHGLFSAEWENMVGNWCIFYYAKYKKAPAQHIQIKFEEWSEAPNRDKDTVQAVENYLAGLSDDHDRMGKYSPEVIIDLASKHFNRVKIASTMEDVQLLMEKGDLEKADQMMKGYRKIEMGLGAGIDLFNDMNALKTASSEKRSSLINFGDTAIANFLTFSMERDGLICFLGKNKVGKSFVLMDIAWRAATQGLKVAFFGIGDMTQNQYLHRYMSRACDRPYRGEPKEPVIIKRPVQLHTGDFPNVDVEETIYTTPLDPKVAWQKMQEIWKRQKISTFKLSCHANGTIGTAAIASIIDGWILDGWVPDCIVIDYADLLQPAMGYDPAGREHINQNWKDLRAMSQVYHALVVTASQTDTPGFDAPILTRKNFNGDRRILDHVTGMIGLNQTSREHELEIVRWNWVVGRDWQYSEDKCCYVAGCKGICSPAMLSSF